MNPGDLAGVVGGVAARAPERPAVVGDGGVFSWSDLRDAVGAVSLAEGVVGLRVRPDGPGLARFLARIDAGRPTVLLPAGGDLADHAAGLGLDLAVDGAAAVPGPGGAAVGPGDVAFVTSGTTGTPKVVRHTLASLTRPVRTGPSLDGAVWLATFPLNLYAGLQVLFHVVLGGGTLVAPPGRGGVDALARRMVEAGVTHVSATPSWWRRLLLFADRSLLEAARPRRITLGGEVADQALLDALREVWPDAGIAHIYATSELGRCFSVRDGRAGFPAVWLAAGTPDGVGLRIVDGELQAASANRMRGYAGADADDGWVATGDLVEVVGDRVFFVGRRTERINVGGNKVDPLVVEQVLRRCPAVRDVRVFARRSSLAGELVAAEIVPVGDPAQAREAARAWAVAHLTDAQRPRSWRVVDEIAVSDAGKRVRRA